MRRIVLLLALALIHGSFWAQFSITGKIINSSGEPLSGANVIINQTFRGVVVGSDGKYKISGLKPGTYRLKASFLGFRTYETEVKLDKDIFLDIPLEPAVYLGEEVIVKAWRVGANSPVNHTNVVKDELRKNDLGQDLPALLSLTPSLVSTSDAGTGIGYSSFRIRGTDLTRINVMVNGIPLNDPESHGVWWVDLPDIGGSIENAQLQRGVGTSANGAAAFGATINLQTLTLSEKPYAELNSSAGSFNTWKNSIRFGTGLISQHFAFDGRLSKISSDGFIDRSFSDLKSFYFSGGYYSAKTIVKFVTFSGNERTYQAWNGIPKAKLNNDISGMRAYIVANGLDAEDSINLFRSGRRTYNLYTYPNQTDNYQQDHYQLHFSHEFLPCLTLTASLHYTHGRGYYEEFKKRQNFADYGLANLYAGTDSIAHFGMGAPEGYYENGFIDKTDLVRRKWLDNGFYGTVFSINYTHGKFDWTLGGAWNTYEGNHFGNIIWNRFVGNEDINHEWYRGKARKNDFNIFMKSTLRLTESISLYADLQYRHIYYNIKGIDDNLRNIGQIHFFDFFNPKLGLNFTPGDRQVISFTYGVAHREPTRSNYTDADPGKPGPSGERLMNYELGYQVSWANIQAGLNLYAMDYKNQLVLTGQINDVGDPVMTNVGQSYRAGLELIVRWNIYSNLHFTGNATFSRNKILQFTEYVDNWDYYNDPKTQPYQWVNELGTTDLAFSPAVVSGGELEWKPFRDFTVSWQSKYVGRQYIDNTSSSDRILDAYSVTNLVFRYILHAKWMKELTLECMVNNFFNTDYLSNAWVYRYYSESRYQSIDGYFPQAGRNFMGGIMLSF